MHELNSLVWVPMTTKVELPTGLNLRTAESFFRLMFEKYLDPQLDIARSIMKYANCLGATLTSIEKDDKHLKILLCFSSSDELEAFQNGFPKAVTDR